ncbi:MAG: ATP-binding protein [Porphyromonadaceae bacterium]|nr:ATP-binding protein [Porphyromonadaceae bacterium]
MRLRAYFFILSLMIITLAGLLLLWFSPQSRWQFLVIVGLIGLLLSYLVFFYRRTVRPLQSISNGMDLLREQDFSSRLRAVGQFEADRIIDIFNRMMEQLKNERLHLREQNEFLDLLIKASPMGVVVMDYDRRITTMNPAAIRILGIQTMNEVEGRTLDEIRDRVLIDLTVVPLHETRTIGQSDGSLYKCRMETFVDRGFPRPFYLIESLTEEVREAEKKAYEQVIRMISHEVNNTVAGITSTIDTVIEELTQTDGMEDIRQAMCISVERCYSMSRFITNFANVVKIPPAELVPTNLNRLIESMTRFMEVMCLDRDISIKLKLDDRLPQIELDAPLIEQTLQNIIKNSVESIDRSGEIVIRTDAETGKLEIADNGSGISPEVAGKLFCPFFSTKATGQGIGLLFIREVLSQHGFRYSLRTETDGWTRFTIWLQ